MKLYHRLGLHDGLKTEGVKWTSSSLTERAQSHRIARKLWGEKSIDITRLPFQVGGSIYVGGKTTTTTKTMNLSSYPNQLSTTVLAAAGPSLQGIYLPRQCLLKCRLSSLPQGYRCSSAFPFQEGEEPGCLAPLLEITSPQFLWKTVPTAQRKCSYRACPVGNRTCPVGCRSLNLKVGLKHWTNPLWSFSNRP